MNFKPSEFPVIALIWIVASFITFCFAQTDEHLTTDSEPHDIFLADHLHGQWLSIMRINHKQPAAEFNPNWTYIKVEPPITPVIKKRGNTYYIEFTSELTKDLP